MADLRGLGGVPGPTGGYDKHSMAADIRAVVLSEFGDQPVVMCGHDLGAYVAFAYALGHRDFVDALVIVDAPPPATSYLDQLMANPRTWHFAFHSNVDVAHMLIGGRERAYIAHFIASRAFDFGAISAEEIDAYAAVYSAPGALRAALEMYRALPRDRELNLAGLAAGGKLRMPVTVVGSAMTAAAGSMQDMADEFAVNGRVEIVQRCGHWIPQEQPVVLARIIRAAATGGSS
jgi:pimeloyl-ACP methyl ester carboxylesterase